MNAVLNQVEIDYDYIATLYTALGKVDTLKTVNGFERFTEDGVGTFVYSLGDNYLYINPCIGCYLAGETIAADMTVAVSLINQEGELLSDFCINFNISRDINADINNYADIVRNVMNLVTAK